jgi:hypothetical protein
MQSHSQPRYRICPHCGCTHFHETQWKGFVERCVLYMWGLQPYQCRECYKRFYLRPLENAGKGDKLVKRDLTEGIGQPGNKTEAAAGTRTYR